jgi:uncharacterized Zn finger protein
MSIEEKPKKTLTRHELRHHLLPCPACADDETFRLVLAFVKYPVRCKECGFVGFVRRSDGRFTVRKASRQ